MRARDKVEGGEVAANGREGRVLGMGVDGEWRGGDGEWRGGKRIGGRLVNRAPSCTFRLSSYQPTRLVAIRDLSQRRHARSRHLHSES